MANINQSNKDNLFKAFGSFIEAFRAYVVLTLIKEAGDKWPAWYVEALHPTQRDAWNLGLKNGTQPENLIDYQNIKSFALKYRDLIKNDFGKDVNKVATWLESIYDVRNKMSHFQEISDDEFLGTFLSMKAIAKALDMNELEEELSNLQEKKTQSNKTLDAVYEGNLKPWFLNVTPHLDIRQGRLDESVFAANLAEVALGNGREIYNNPVVFFSKTYFTAGLKSIAKTVITGLNGNGDAENRIISLQTGFGGGKTHTLISLYHICKWGKNSVDSEYARELIEYTGSPKFDSANIAVFTNTTNDPANGRDPEEGIHISTIWGEIAYQLGGKEAYEIVRKNDEQLIAPGGTFKQVLNKCKPALILVDELADYCVKASARVTGKTSLADQTISFMQELTEAVAGTDNCVAVITLPASPQEVGNTPEAQAILSSLQKRVSRVGADTQPVADDEIYEVIRRRLFEEIGSKSEIEQVATKYLELYQQFWVDLPPHANTTEYKQRLIKTYPFHPELIDIFRVRWASHHDFQRTRGVLRLLAAIVSDLWKRQQSLPGSNLLIHSGEINYANLDALSGQLKKLYGNGYDAVITADIAGSSSNSFKIDSNKKEYGQWYLTQAISSVILSNSFGNEGANKGVSVADIKLHLLTPGGFNHNNVNGALDELESSAYYLYYASAGGSLKRYWFNTKPNINILINQAKADIKPQDIDAEILRRIKDKQRNVNLFNLLIDPDENIPEQTKPTLIIMHPRYQANPNEVNGKTKPIIQKIATEIGSRSRVYRNTILFLVSSEVASGTLNSNIRDYLACQKISIEYASQLEREQKDDTKRRMDEASKASDSSIVTAYSIIVKYSAVNGINKLLVQQFTDSLDNQINGNITTLLKEEEWLLDNIGLGVLRSNNLIPTADQQTIKVKDVYEAFLRFDDKPMITSHEAVGRSIQRYSLNNEICVATGDGVSFTKFFIGQQIPFFDVNDTTYWLVDQSLIPAPNVEPTSPAPFTNHPPTSTTGVVPGGGAVENPVKPYNVQEIKSLIISGRVPLENFTSLFPSFIATLAHNNVEIEIKIKGTSNSTKQITENSPEYKIIKESAKQMGLNLSEEK